MGPPIAAPPPTIRARAPLPLSVVDRILAIGREARNPAGAPYALGSIQDPAKLEAVPLLDPTDRSGGTSARFPRRRAHRRGS